MFREISLIWEFRAEISKLKDDASMPALYDRSNRLIRYQGADKMADRSRLRLISKVLAWCLDAMVDGLAPGVRDKPA